MDNIPVPESYLLGPGDTLNIMLYGKEQSQEVFKVDREGAIYLPNLGAISASGLSFPEAKRLIEQRVSRQMIGTEVLVSMGALRSINVFNHVNNLEKDIHSCTIPKDHASFQPNSTPPNRGLSPTRPARHLTAPTQNTYTIGWGYAEAPQH